MSRGGRQAVHFDEASGNPLLQLKAYKTEKMENVKAGRLAEMLGLSARKIITAEEFGDQAWLFCREAEALDEIDPSDELLNILKTTGGLIISGPTGSGPEKCFETLCLGGDSRPWQNLADLRSHGTAALFWSRTLTASRLKIRHRGFRISVLTADIQNLEEPVNISGRVHNIFKADPMTAELSVSPNSPWS